MQIVVSNGLFDCPNTYCVLCDEEAAMYKAVCALYHAGCHHILYLYDSLTYSGTQKLAGFRRAVLEKVGNLKSALELRVPKCMIAARDQVTSLLISGQKFDAIVASEDLLAVGAVQSLQIHGLKLPVIGFNNSVLAQCCIPGLSSIDNLVETLCTTACDVLYSVLEGKSAPRCTVLQAKMVERETFKM